MNKIYISEIILVISTNDLPNFKYWLFWHINIIKFDHIIIIDNDSTVNLYSECLKYNNVEYIKKSGSISQSDIYTYYVNNSKAYWCICLDDDEFLYISDKYKNSINYFIKLYTAEHSDYLKLAFPWAMMRSCKLLQNRNFETPVFEIFDQTMDNTIIELNNYPTKVECISCVKTLVNTLIKHYYAKDTEKIIQIDRETIDLSPNRLYEIYQNVPCTQVFYYDKLGTVHNPVSKLFNTYVHAINVMNNQINIGYCSTAKINIQTDAFIAHYKFKTIDEWNYKTYFRNKFNDLYSTYNLFYTDDRIKEAYIKTKIIYNDKLKLLWNKYKHEMSN